MRSLRRRAILAAPIVLTTSAAVVACSGPTYMNPGPSFHGASGPVESASSAPGDAPPLASADPTAPTSDEPEQPLPKEPGEIVKGPDGVCRFVFPVPHMECDPGDSCNPGPPRKPVRVKCPDGGGKK